MPESSPAATDHDLNNFLRAILDARMRRAGSLPAWYLLLMAVLGIFNGGQCFRDLERFAIRHQSVLTDALAPVAALLAIGFLVPLLLPSSERARSVRSYS